MDVCKYLTLPTKYCQSLGGLRWSATDDAIVYANGETFAFSVELTLFLQGFVAGRSLIHIGWIFHLLDLLRGKRAITTPEIVQFRKAFRDAGSSLRNAGAFCAALCYEVPGVPEHFDIREVCDRLHNQASPMRWFVAQYHDVLHQAEVPTWEPPAFEAHIVERLAAYSAEELFHWFRHGRGPVREPGQKLADPFIMAAPRSLAALVTSLLNRPRLAGAVPFIHQLVSALSLPPRRLDHSEFPVGGYTDVTTRGNPDQILPSQFALDEWDFFRRLAEDELLYFRREEPNSPVKDELVVVLDQGVRTWGDVRLVLSAAALVLAQRAARKKSRFYLSATSAEGRLFDPLDLDSESLGGLIEASDLSPHPGLTLEGVLQEPSPLPRDVVLLSHPRNVKEPDVAAAARRTRPGVRLFSLAVDAQGNAEWCEMKHGAPVKLRQFRVDFTKAVSPRPAPGACDGPLAPWRGAVEPIGFPFRFGVSGSLGGDFFDFDDSGEWLLAAGKNGMLYAWRTDGSSMEILPRAMIGGKLVSQVNAVVGVAGGFVVAGQISLKQVIVHYDFTERTCRAYDLGAGGFRQWTYSRKFHSVVAYTEGTCHALDLTTGDQYPGSTSAKAFRAKEAAELARSEGLPVRTVPVLTEEPNPSEQQGKAYLYANLATGQIQVQWPGVEWKPFTPLADGAPVLHECYALQAQCCGNILAVQTCTRRSADWKIRLFLAPDGISVSEFKALRRFGFVLSWDGKRIARQVGSSQLEVRETRGSGYLLTRTGGYHPELQFRLGDGWLVAHHENHLHLVRWDGPTAEVRYTHQNAKDFLIRELGMALYLTGHQRCPGWLHAAAQYDSKRFLAGAQAQVAAVSDRYGQIAITNSTGNLVCMFFFFRRRAAIWMPDGTRWGPPKLTGGPPTPNALARIAQALRKASETNSEAKT
jgi:hypothetical protein